MFPFSESICGQRPDRSGDILGSHQDMFFKYFCETDRRIEGRDASHGCVEQLEIVLGDVRGDLSTESTREVGLMHHESLAGSADALFDAPGVQRYDRAQVNDLCVDSFECQLFSRPQAQMNSISIGDDAEIPSRTTDGRASDRDAEIRRGEGGLCPGVILQVFPFKLHGGTAGPEGAAQEPRGILGEGRHDDAESGNICQHALDAL